MIRYRLLCGTSSATIKTAKKSAHGSKAVTAATGSTRAAKQAARGCGQEFESWFQDSDAFDKLLKRGQIACPACGSTSVEKALMAPNVKTTKGKKPAVPAHTSRPTPSAGGHDPRQLATLTPEQRNFVEAMRKIREHVLSTSENVGPKFAEEARKIHYEETEPRSIHGEASLQDAKALADEGIDVFPIPDLPDDRN